MVAQKISYRRWLWSYRAWLRSNRRDIEKTIRIYGTAYILSLDSTGRNFEILDNEKIAVVTDPFGWSEVHEHVGGGEIIVHPQKVVFSIEDLEKELGHKRENRKNRTRTTPLPSAGNL